MMTDQEFGAWMGGILRAGNVSALEAIEREVTNVEAEQRQQRALEIAIRRQRERLVPARERDGSRIHARAQAVSFPRTD